MTEKVPQNKLKKIQNPLITWLMTSCPSFAREKSYQLEHYFPANFLCRVIKGWLSTALALVSLKFEMSDVNWLFLNTSHN